MDITKNKKYKDFTKLSRYQTTPIMYNELDNRYKFNKASGGAVGVQYMCGTAKYLDKDSLYTTHIVQIGDTLDVLSLWYYGNPTYYWMIADFNDIFDPFQPLKVGEKIKIPTLGSVQFKY